MKKTWMFFQKQKSDRCVYVDKYVEKHNENGKKGMLYRKTDIKIVDYFLKSKILNQIGQ